MDKPTPLQLASQKMAEMRASGVPVVRLDPIEKARANPTSLRAAINGKCWDCVGRDCDPKPRARIGGCPVKACPLYPVRPYQSHEAE